MNNSNIADFTAANGITFRVRVVMENDRYGTEMCLTHKGPRFKSFGPLVELYDSRRPTDYLYVGTKEDAIKHGAMCLGRFAASYYSRTFLAHTGNGLCLRENVEAWRIDPATLKKMQEFVSSITHATV